MMTDPLLSPEEQMKSLVRQGVPRDKAERAVFLSQNHNARDHMSNRTREPEETVDIAWPLMLTVPWSALVSDDERFGVIDGRMILQKRYREAREKIRQLASRAIDGAALAAEPLSLTVYVWVPDNRIHDITNFCKIVHDGLEKGAIENDRWLHDVHWIRAGVDVDHPRAELTLHSITTGTP